MEPQELTGQVRRIVAFSWAIAIGAKPIFIDRSRLGAVLEGGHNSEARFAGEEMSRVRGPKTFVARITHGLGLIPIRYTMNQIRGLLRDTWWLWLVFSVFVVLAMVLFTTFYAVLLSVPAGCDDLFRPDALRQKRSVPR